MSELTEFLLARIAEDEEVARAATLGHDGRPVDVFDWDHGPSSERDMTPAQDEAHRTWSPWRALAECAAKRAIVADHRWREVEERAPKKVGIPASRVTRTYCATCCDERCEAFAEPHDEGRNDAPCCRTLRHMAAVYADHPDYREEWRP